MPVLGAADAAVGMAWRSMTRLFAVGRGNEAGQCCSGCLLEITARFLSASNLRGDSSCSSLGLHVFLCTEH